MRKSIRTALACIALAALAVPALHAQDEPQKDPKQVIWVMTYSGGGG